MSNAADHVLLVCSTCRGTVNADAIAAALRPELPSSFVIRTVDCMAGCASPTTVGFQGNGKAHYLFGGIETAQDLDALAEFARQYDKSVDGWTNASDRPAALYEKTLARIPALVVRPEK